MKPKIPERLSEDDAELFLDKMKDESVLLPEAQEYPICVVYTVAEISDITLIPAPTIYSWTDKPQWRIGFRFDRNNLTFHTLVEIWLIRQLRECGSKLVDIEQARDKMEAAFGTEHPLAHVRFKTEALEFLGPPWQPYYWDKYDLCKDFDYHEKSGLVGRWKISEGVVIDPKRSFGKPIVDEVGKPTMGLYRSYLGNEHDEFATADWWGVEPRHVLLAVAYEMRKWR